jgi:hypothetical protein
MSFTAKYRGSCGKCESTIEPGHQAEYDEDDQLQHAGVCPDPEPDLILTGTACTDCHMVHGSHQKECW